MPTTNPTDTDPPAAGAAIRTLLRRAEGGDATALPGLRLFLDAHPGVWKEAGDLGLQARRAWAGLAAGPNLVVSESVGRRVDEVRAAAAGPAPTPLEGLLADRVAVTWAACNYFDVLLAQHKGRGLSAAQEEYLDRLRDRAQRQHLRAVKTLAAVHKLLPKPATPPLSDEQAGGGGGDAAGTNCPTTPTGSQRGRRRDDRTAPIPGRLRGVGVTN